LIRSAVQDDLEQIRTILNHEIETSTASWTTVPKSVADMQSWFDQRQRGGFPVLVAEVDGSIAGYGSYGPFRTGEGYAGTVEHTVYVAEGFRRHGIAQSLVRTLLEKAQADGFQRMIGGVSSGADGSYALHQTLGFEDCGRLPGVGRKFDLDLDLNLMVYRLD